MKIAKKSLLRGAAVGVSAVAAAAVVVAAPASATSYSNAAVPTARTVHLADGTVMTVQTYTGAEVAELPALPKGHRYGSTVTVRHITLPKNHRSTAVEPSGITHPDSATGCTPYGGMGLYKTCIVVTGSGLHEDSWVTGTNTAGPNVTAYYEAGGVTVMWDEYVDAPPGYFTDNPGYGPSNWPNGTKLCNWWNGSLAGKAMPCITIQG